MEIVSNLMKEYRELSNNIKELESLKDDVRTNLMLELKTRDLTSFEDDENIVTCTFAKRQMFDKQKAIEFIQEHEGEPNDFFTANEYETLRVKGKSSEVTQ